MTVDPFAWFGPDDYEKARRELIVALTEFADLWDDTVQDGVDACEEHANGEDE